ncbi:DUF6282 family protein [Psychrobacillus sp. NPDC093180]|uniref:DUF6282 family protein n=1 Tax=Psychrobacillus sp. NPDC093180 TaxID=3364489 RepID=UPI0037F479D5
MKLQGVIDMHVHSAPDIRERAHDDLVLTKQAQELEVRAFVLKSHYFPTTDRAWLMNQLQNEVLVFGSITLNYSVGGINAIAVKHAANLGAKIVWLPTIDAKNHRMHEGEIGGIHLIKDEGISEELNEIFNIIVQYDLVLATGHISKDEILYVVNAARKAGVKKIVVTHPEFHILGLTIADQKHLVEEYEVIFERTYAQPIGNKQYKVNLPEIIAAIKELGYESTLISTDSGQIENPAWNVTLPSYLTYLRAHGIEEEAIKYMTQTLPSYLLNLEKI